MPGHSQQEAVTLASIVEKETGKASERRMVAGVYCNRLRIGMKLDADPTVIYPITKGKPLGRRIRRSELMAQTPATTPTASRVCRSDRSPIRAAKASPRCWTRRRHEGHLFRGRRHRRACVRRDVPAAQANVKRWYAIRRQRGEM